MLRKFTKEERGWIMYDWANSAFAAIIMAIILPNFYATLTEHHASAGPWWGYATTIGTFASALLAPILGTLGDYKGYKKRLFTIFALIGIIGTALLAFTANWQLLLVFYIIGTIGFNAANIFYDGFLTDVTTHDRMDMVSTYGYGLGYIGGSTIPLLISLVFVLFGSSFGVSATLACQISFMITAVWWFVFSIPMLRHVQQKHYVLREKGLMSQSFSRLRSVAKAILKEKHLVLFLVAYFFYIDGVGTIIHMATIFGRAMGLDSNFLIIVLLVVQIVAFPFAILYGKLSKKYGVRSMIITGIVTYMLVCVVALSLGTLQQFGDGAVSAGFILLAFLVGTAQGGIQALSRSYYGKLIPIETANEYFGFFDIFGKFSAVVGPLAFSLVWDATNNVTLGIVPVFCMFVIGMICFLLVPKDVQGKA